jgi:toxin ParE1/3/4
VKLRYTLQATNDLQQIEHFYRERVDAEVAERLLVRLVDKLERLLGRNPRLGRLRPELGLRIRSFPVTPYVVFYSVKNRHVYVQRVLHGHRDIRPPITSLLCA